MDNSGRQTAPPQFSSQLPSNFKMISSKVEYDHQMTPGMSNLLRKSEPQTAALLDSQHQSRIIGQENTVMRETIPGGRNLQERNEDLIRRNRDADIKIRELEDRLQSMTLERDKIITDYERYIDKLTEEKDQLKGLEGMVRKLEKEKEFLENEIEKVRAIKMMLENQLNAYSESAEIIKYKQENDRLNTEMKRLRNIVYTETGQEGDPNKMDIVKAISKYKSEVHYITQDNQKMSSEKAQMQRRIEELEDQLRFAQGDTNVEVKQLRHQITSQQQQIAGLQQINLEAKRTETENKQLMTQRVTQLENENMQLRTKVDNLKGISMNTNMDGGNYVQEINNLKRKIADLQNTAANPQEIEFLRNEMQRAGERANRLEDRNKMLEQQMQSMAANTGTAPNSQPLMNELRMLNERIRQADAENQQLRMQLNQALNRAQSADRDLDQLRRSTAASTNMSTGYGPGYGGPNQGAFQPSANQTPGGAYRGTGGPVPNGRGGEFPGDDINSTTTTTRRIVSQGGNAMDDPYRRSQSPSRIMPNTNSNGPSIDENVTTTTKVTKNIFMQGQQPQGSNLPMSGSSQPLTGSFNELPPQRISQSGSVPPRNDDQTTTTTTSTRNIFVNQQQPSPNQPMGPNMGQNPYTQSPSGGPMGINNISNQQPQGGNPLTNGQPRLSQSQQPEDSTTTTTTTTKKTIINQQSPSSGPMFAPVNSTPYNQDPRNSNPGMPIQPSNPFPSNPQSIQPPPPASQNRGQPTPNAGDEETTTTTTTKRLIVNGGQKNNPALFESMGPGFNDPSVSAGGAPRGIAPQSGPQFPQQDNNHEETKTTTTTTKNIFIQQAGQTGVGPNASPLAPPSRIAPQQPTPAQGQQSPRQSNTEENTTTTITRNIMIQQQAPSPPVSTPSAPIPIQQPLTNGQDTNTTTTTTTKKVVVTEAVVQPPSLPPLPLVATQPGQNESSNTTVTKNVVVHQTNPVEVPPPLPVVVTSTSQVPVPVGVQVTSTQLPPPPPAGVAVSTVKVTEIVSPPVGIITHTPAVVSLPVQVQPQPAVPVPPPSTSTTTTTVVTRNVVLPGQISALAHSDPNISFGEGLDPAHPRLITSPPLHSAVVGPRGELLDANGMPIIAFNGQHIVMSPHGFPSVHGPNGTFIRVTTSGHPLSPRGELLSPQQLSPRASVTTPTMGQQNEAPPSRIGRFVSSQTQLQQSPPQSIVNISNPNQTQPLRLSNSTTQIQPMVLTSSQNQTQQPGQPIQGGLPLQQQQGFTQTQTVTQTQTQLNFQSQVQPQQQQVQQQFNASQNNQQPSISPAVVSSLQERVSKLEHLLSSKQRENDDLLLRMFLVAAENDRLRNEDQLLQNIKILKHNPLLQESLKAHDQGGSPTTIPDTMHKILPQVNQISSPPVDATRERSPVITEVRRSSVPAPLHSEQVYHHSRDNDGLYQKLTRNNKDIESIIQDIYEKHGLTQPSVSQPTPTRSHILKTLEITESKSAANLPPSTLRKAQLDEYFEDINRRLANHDAEMTYLQKLTGQNFTQEPAQQTINK